VTHSLPFSIASASAVEVAGLAKEFPKRPFECSLQGHAFLRRMVLDGPQQLLFDMDGDSHGRARSGEYAFVQSPQWQCAA